MKKNRLLKKAIISFEEYERLVKDGVILEQRIDKAIKYINKNQVGYGSLINCTIPIEELFTTNMELLNILKGEDK